jgi:hypothetical protein
MAERARSFLEEAPTSAATAATIILDGVKADRWRILVGEDAHKVDEWVRRTPERAYDADALKELVAPTRLATRLRLRSISPRDSVS